MAIFAREFAPGAWEVVCPSYSQKLRDTAKVVPGVRWDPARRAWVGYKDGIWAALSRLKAQGLNVDIECFKITADKRLELEPIAKNYSYLREYQKEAVRFIVPRASSGVLLADDMGLGKSAVALYSAAWIASSGYENIVIVCPNAVKLWWADQASKLPTGGEGWQNALVRVELLSGVKNKFFENYNDGSDAQGLRIRIINYDILYAWLESPRLEKIDVLILDEGHYTQTPKSRRSKACKVIRARSKNCIVLTGTPITNRVKNAWNLIDVMSPNRMGGFFGFGMVYCGAYQDQIKVGDDIRTVWNFDGRSNEKELATRLRFFMLRRTAKDVGLELPPMTRQIIHVDVPPRAQRKYSATTLSDSRAVRECLDLAADHKIIPGIELVLSHAQAGHNVVAFTYRKAVAEQVVTAARAEGLTAEIVYGPTQLKTRKKRIDAKPQVLACTIASCSTGIDLTFADVAVFLEITYSPHELMQAEARPNRFGQKRNVLIQYVIARGTIDELVVNAVIDKIDGFKAVLGKKGGVSSLQADLIGKEDPLKALVAAFEAFGKGDQ